MIKAAIIERVDLPIVHLVGTAPGYGAGSNRNALGLAGCEQQCRVIHRALHVVAATQRITGVGKALLEVDHDERRPLTESDIALTVASLCKLIHRSWGPVVSITSVTQYDLECADVSRTAIPL